ncbi:MAG TPA: hypothetical protein VFX12_02480 [Vicinamibacterales bacterium]|nr:hypothetical protein [Vicinamibacterales bacterium]
MRVRDRQWTIVVAAALALAAAGVTAEDAPRQSNQFPKPTLDTGPVQIVGHVTVDRSSEAVNVTPAEGSQWTARIASQPPVAYATPSFVKKGGTYDLETIDGGRRTIRVLDVREDGWVLATAPDGSGRFWCNLAQVPIVSEAR